jgi:Flp pilus assembly protein TadG
MRSTTMRQRCVTLADERGVATPEEMMFLLLFCLTAVLFLGYLGRLHATGVQVTNAAQAAARVASQAHDPSAARAAATDIVQRSALRSRCNGGVRVTTAWSPSPTGAWQGGSVTVAVACTVRNQSLAGVWSPGSRTVSMRDTQPVDRYRR